MMNPSLPFKYNTIIKLQQNLTIKETKNFYIYIERETVMENSKDETVKNWEKKKKPSSPKLVGKFLKKKRGRFYIIGKCIYMLLCSHE